MKTITSKLIFCIIFTLSIVKGSEPYFTYDILEPDRIGCAWIITHFLDTGAIIHYIPKDSTLANAEGFDIPSSRYRRYPRMSATKSIVYFNKVTDIRALRIAQLMDQIELGYWGAGKSKEAEELEMVLWETIRSDLELDSILIKSFHSLDSVSQVN